ncbi:DUF4031 domain-containing protein [Pseudomonas sp. NPDC088444]|uniref:DUF4031 domain-containing protein n=1 Tax=Pseudomonas sp. NPDC088444 TaxID=3364456 RepID=UPI00384F3BF7
MTVYVDNEQIPYRRMKMCHMLADTEDELHAMADKIGVARRWHQFPGSVKSHYDICQSKRDHAIRLGAKEIDRQELGAIIKARRAAVIAKAQEGL